MKTNNLSLKKIIITIISAIIVIGISLTSVLILNKQNYPGKDMEITPPPGRTPIPSPSQNKTIPEYSVVPDIYVIDNLAEERIKFIYPDSTVTDINGTKCSYDKTLDKTNIVLIDSNNSLWLINKKRSILLTSFVEKAYISDFGEYIFYTETYTSILWRYDINSNSVTMFYDFYDNQSIDYFAISPDGNSIVCTRGGMTYGVSNFGIEEIKKYANIVRVLAAADDLSLIYGYNRDGELICVDSENRVHDLKSDRSGNIYFSNTRKNVIFPESDKFYSFNGNEIKAICERSDIVLLEDERNMKKITEHVYIVNKSDFAYCYMGNDQYTYLIGSDQEAKLYSEYKINIFENSKAYYYIKDNYLYFYDEDNYSANIQQMHVKDDYNIIKVFNEYEENNNTIMVYYLNSKNELCLWNRGEKKLDVKQPDINNICFLPNGGKTGDHFAYLVDKNTGVRIYKNGEEIKLIEWTPETLEMKLTQTPSGIILSWTENSNNSQFNTEKLYLLNNDHQVLLGTRNK